MGYGHHDMMIRVEVSLLDNDSWRANIRDIRTFRIQGGEVFLNGNPIMVDAYGPTPQEAISRAFTLASIIWRQIHQGQKTVSAPPTLDPSAKDLTVILPGFECYVCGQNHDPSNCPNVEKKSE